MQLGDVKLLLQALPDSDGNIFGSGNCGGELGDLFVEVAMVHGVDDFAIEDVFEFFEIDHEAGDGIDFAFHGDFEGVVVAVSVEVGALAEGAQVLLFRPLRIVVEVRRGKLTFAGQVDHAASSKLQLTGGKR